ncbi:cell division initiation protein [Tissierella praeacuta DSM 18095]|uniref:Cell division initiation protein n=1 Tax=Tissierella praeacuta DSM 18095 TaxID=1123404 RepID=A0A1M4S9U6_9FIRM|nr:DivIVA domain-containing protein [Tissierella praeacuta]TCU71748.1 cell division initiation protein [Tissierella praeacuta]SHE28971.1 cell division initiation protein [Tissierella praeacuta DSM 18095]SUP01175.1 Minicell-associated protein DivIVA [Tissierella praeacuta]
MITPLDIQSKQFKRSLMGYNTKEVDDYLDAINDNYEMLYRENIELKDKIGVLTDQIRQYNNLEETLKSTLVIAQSTADDVTSSARKKAELIIEDAELQAKNRIDEAKNEVRNIMKEYDYLKKEIFIFKTRYESFIKAQLISINEFYKDYENKNQSNEINLDEENMDESENLKEIDHLGA